MLRAVSGAFSAGSRASACGHASEGLPNAAPILTEGEDGRQLLASGAKVMATDFDATQLAEMQATSAALHVHAGDISKEDDVAALFARARDAMGGCNVLINNAGILRDRALVKKDKHTGECCPTLSVGKGRARVGEGGVTPKQLVLLSVDCLGVRVCDRLQLRVTARNSAASSITYGSRAFRGLFRVICMRGAIY